MDKKALSLPMLIAMVVGNMVGSGIYVLPASLAGYGTISIVSWILTSIGAMFLAMVFVYLNQRFPKTGGPYVYCKQAFGNLVGFIIAVFYWFSMLISIAGISIVSVGYLGYLFPSLDANTPLYNQNVTLMIELGIVWFFTAINMIGIHFSGVVQLILTIVKTTPLIVIILFGVSHIELANLKLFNPGNLPPLSAIGGAAALTFWAFIGIEAATLPAENTRGPKDINRATIFGTMISSLIYIGCTFVIMGMIPVTQLQSSQFPFAEVAVMLFGTYGAILIALFAALCGVGALNICVFLQGQIVFAAARDNIFPHWLAKLSKKDVPFRSLIVSGLIVSAMLVLTMQPNLINQFNMIAQLAALAALLVYMVCAFSELKFTAAKKAKLHHVLMSKSMFIALVAGLYSVWTISCVDARTLKIGVITIGICVIFYYFMIRRYADK